MLPMENSHSFRRNLIALLVALQVVTVTMILFISRVSHDNVLLDQARVLLSNASQDALRHTQAFLRPAVRTTLNTVDLFNQDALKSKTNVENYFLSQLQINNEFAGMYYATTSGEFFYVSRNAEKANSVYRTKDMFYQDNQKFTTLGWRDEALAPVAPTEFIDDTYNPLERPWYIAALAARDLIWSAPYVFFTSKKIGITIAKPFYKNNNIAGVIGIDIEISDLSNFLSTLNLGETGNALIMDQSGQFIAISGQQNEQKQDQFRLSFADTFQEKLAQQAGQTYLKNNNHSQAEQRFVFENTEYLATFIPFTLENKEQAWVLVTYAEQNAFLRPIRLIERLNVFIAICILVVSVLIGLALTKRISAPVLSWHDQAISDQLTGLYNRRYLEMQGKRLYERAQTHDSDVLSLAIIDIDDFKLVNDKFGHAYGDEVLAQLATFMRLELRPQDYIFRYGGEEFIILFPKTRLENAIQILTRFQDKLRNETLLTSKGPLAIRLSVGVGDTVGLGEDITLDNFIALTDKALYDAKAQGKDSLVALYR